MSRRSSTFRPQARQRGVVLIMSLVILVVLLGAAAALVRSFDTSLLVAGNLAFKRDLVNQAERAVPGIMTALQTATQLGTPADRAANNAAFNYSATALPTNPQGIPTVLLASTATFDGSGFASSARDIQDAAQGVRIRYVVDRLCSATGDERTILEGCITSTNEPSLGRDNPDQPNAEVTAGNSGVASPIPQQVVYRLSLRVDGPRDTQAFMQATFTR
jgi:type IV pilus assembly protein PilX